MLSYRIYGQNLKLNIMKKKTTQADKDAAKLIGIILIGAVIVASVFVLDECFPALFKGIFF